MRSTMRSTENFSSRDLGRGGEKEGRRKIAVVSGVDGWVGGSAKISSLLCPFSFACIFQFLATRRFQTMEVSL